MHINGRGHRPLTSPFSWGRGTGLCESGFNDPIVDLCHVPSYSMYSLSYISPPFCSHDTLAACLLPEHPATENLGVWIQIKIESLVLYLPCCLHPAALSRSSALPTSVLISSPIMSCPQPPLLPSRPYLCFPSLLSFCIFSRGAWLLIRSRQEKTSTSEQNPLIHFAPWNSQGPCRKKWNNLWPNMTSHRSAFQFTAVNISFFYRHHKRKVCSFLSIHMTEWLLWDSVIERAINISGYEKNHKTSCWTVKLDNIFEWYVLLYLELTYDFVRVQPHR